MAEDIVERTVFKSCFSSCGQVSLIVRDSLSSNVSARCPFPSVLNPNHPCLKSYGIKGSYQQQSPTEQWDLLSGDWIWPDHTTMWPFGFLLGLLQFLLSPPPSNCFLPDQRTWRPLVRGHWVILNWWWGPSGSQHCGQSLPLVDPALMSDIPGSTDPAQSGYQSDTVRSK